MSTDRPDEPAVPEDVANVSEKAAADATAARSRQVTRRAKLRAAAEQARVSGLTRFLAGAGSVVASIADRGLLQPAADPPQIEAILVTDTWVCETGSPCDAPRTRSCPQDATKPHRRSLIVASEKLLRMIGDATAIPAPESSDSNAPRRGIPVHPHLLLLAVQFAAEARATREQLRLAGVPDIEAMPLDPVHDLAEHVFEWFQVLAAFAPTLTDDAARRLLDCFVVPWRDFTKQARRALNVASPTAAKPAEPSFAAAAAGAARGSALPPSSPLLPTAQAATTLQAALELRAVVSALTFGTTPASNGIDIDRLLAAVERRVRVNVVAEAAADNSESPTQPPRLPPRQSEPTGAAAAAPSAPTVSTEAPVAAQQRSASVPVSGGEDFSSMSDGHQRSPYASANESAAASSSSRAAAEKRASLEFKAIQARKVVVPLRTPDPPTSAAQVMHQLESQLTIAFWTQVSQLMSQDPPVLHFLPNLFQGVIQAFVEALPRRLKSRTARDLQDAADWQFAAQRALSGDIRVVEDFLFLMSNKLIEFGAPGRIRTLETDRSQLLHEMKVRDGESSRDYQLRQADVVPRVFRFLVDAVKQLQKDVSDFEMSLISRDLAAVAVPSQRQYVSEYFPPVPAWERSRSWLQSIALLPFRVGDAGDLLKLSMGTLDLCMSAGKPPADRWANFPAELLCFSRPAIFNIANVVQLSVLRLLLSGSVAVVLERKNAPHLFTPTNEEKSRIQTRVDEHVVQLLREPQRRLTSASLLETVAVEINAGLSDALEARNVRRNPEDVFLSEEESRVLQGTVEKMLDTQSPQYRLFESRALAFMQAVVRNRFGVAVSSPAAAAAASPTTDVPTPPALRLVAPELRNAALDVADLAAFDAEAMAPFIAQLNATVPPSE